MLNVDIEFSRAEAVAAAESFSQKQFPELKTDRSAAVFVSNRGLQNYVELEAGGVTAYNSIINNVDAMTHYWKVRKFSESQQKELTTSFSPKGVPLSFWLTVPDEEPGAALEEAAAREIAERGAREFLGERFNAYKSFETVVRKQTSGRADYSFTYEHESLKLAEAKFRIAIRVAGEKLVGIDTISHIPEAFNQRYGEMRSVNDQISRIANFLMMGLWGLGGLIGGGIWLHRRHQLRWKRGFLPALFVGSGMAATVLAGIPMSWMGYNTTISASNFLLQQVVAAGTLMVGSTLIFATIYSVAEGLSRQAFASHPKLFDFFRKPVAATPEALGRVLGGYASAGFFLLYAMSFIVLSRSMGWWSPTDAQTDPNILASWRPALGPIFMAMQAGTWEECLFRAIPLALAAIIGGRYGIRTPLIIFVLILQALIFGGAHANYPQLPGYSRLIELFIPSIFFGLVYLRFGLVVGMLTHFTYDLILMSMPIFVSNDPNLLIDKMLVVLVGTAPLLLVLWARYKAGAFTPLAAEWRNGVAEVPNIPEPVSAPQTVSAVEPEPSGLKPIYLKPIFLLPVALICFAVLIAEWRKPAQIDWLQYQITRAEAKALAEKELATRGVKLEGEWHSAVLTHVGWRQPMDFVWKETNPETFKGLVGRYLDTPLWQITWSKFDGPVEGRSEKWQVYLRADGSLHDVLHTLPEGAAGAKLTREQATAKALGWIVEHGWGDTNQLEEKSVEETVRPARSDWAVKYIDKAAFNQKDGQAVIRITLNGDEVSSTARTIDIPEKWTRAEAEKQSRKMPFNIATGLAGLVLIALALSTFFRKHTGRKIKVGLALPWILFSTLSFLVVSLLWLDGDLVNFQPTTGWNQQLAMSILSSVLQVAVIGVLILFAAQAVYAERPLANATIKSDYILGASIALVVAGLYALASLAFPSKNTPPSYAADWGTYQPLVAVIFNGFKAFIKKLAIIIVLIGAARFLQSRLKLAVFVSLFLVTTVGVVLSADEIAPAIANQVLMFFSFIIMLMLIRRKQLGVLIAMLGVGVALGQANIGNALYSSAWAHAAISMICCLLVTYVFLRHWHRNSVL
ncbi:hypothetical protein GCM10011613_07530 [Cellvibrio zantedeschiae]|uniref:CPBP family intramembrane metalloprotease n=1 Tax=Cellvibrio zantedeschiae TaxID=1237077 RepID=A0ABQ3AUY5_9GAMM|nr:hypothetical protein GCM10011613_07530 [Cellvibrio zantedeschiae]